MQQGTITMDVQVHTAHLHNALERIQLAAKHFGYLGSPGTVHLHSEGTAISLTIDGAMRKLSLRTTGSVARTGGILLPLSDVATMIAQLPATVIRLEVDPPGRQLTITSPGLVITLQGQAPLDVPTMLSSVQWFTLGRCSAHALHHAIEQVRYAIGTNERRPVLNGARLQVHGAQASLSAADGFRVAHTEILLTEPAQHAHDLIIPRDDLYALDSILNGTREAATLRVSPSGSIMMFSTSWADYACDTIEGEYPDISRFVPSAPETYAEVITQSLREAIQIIMCLGYLADRGCIALELVPVSPLATSHVIVKATATDGDAVRSTCEGLVHGQARSSWLNSIFLRDSLEAIRTEYIHIEVTGTNGPIYLCLLYTSPSPRDGLLSRMPSSA